MVTPTSTTADAAGSAHPLPPPPGPPPPPPPPGSSKRPRGATYPAIQIEEEATRALKHMRETLTAAGDDPDPELLFQVLRRMCSKADGRFRDIELKARMMTNVGARWGHGRMMSDAGKVAFSTLVQDAAQGALEPGQLNKAAAALGCCPKTLKRTLADPAPGVPDVRLASSLRQNHGRSIPAPLADAVADWYVAHCRYCEQDKLLELLVSPERLYVTFGRYHEPDGRFVAGGTAEYLEWLAGFMAATKGRLPGTEEYDRAVKMHGDPPNPIGSSKFAQLRPREVHLGKDRTCCCPICVEVEDMMDYWAMRMLVAHGGPDDKLRKTGGCLDSVAVCNDPDCPWNSPPLAGCIPRPFKKRFKNDLVNQASLQANYRDGPAPPFLFCGPCECGACSSTPPVADSNRYPPFMRCRRVNTGSDEAGSSCTSCGWSRKFLLCPTLAADEHKRFNWRCLASTADKELPNVHIQRQAAASTSRAISDQLVLVDTTWTDFSSVLAKRMDEWVEHNFIQRHQNHLRSRARKSVDVLPPHAKILILVDWSEKLSLTPPNSTTAATYAKIGLLQAVTVHKGADGRVHCISHPVLCESPDNDVPHTQAGIREVLINLVKYDPNLRGAVRRIEVWSDGGQAHFKLADGYRQGVHLQAWARSLLGPALTLRWSFCQSYHGKGPYDAEGGIVKYLLRRQQRLQGRAFTSAEEAHAWLVTHIASSTKGAAAEAHVREYTIDARLPGLVLEKDMPAVDSSDYTVGTARAVDTSTAGALQKKRDVFCLEFDAWPAITTTELDGQLYGTSAGPDTDAADLAGPFSNVALRSMPDVEFCGRWRKLTCDCACCEFKDSGLPCTSQGGWSPAPWVRWTVKGAPSKAAAKAWVIKVLKPIVGAIAHLDATSRRSGLDHVRDFAVQRLLASWHIYVSERHCKAFVENIISEFIK